MLENLCRNCFNESSSLPCPHCGYTGEKHKDGAILPVGSILKGKYLIGKCLGRGGFGVTYLALNLSDNKKVCIKEYFPGDISTRAVSSSDVVPYSDSENKSYEYGRERFLDEGKTLAALNSLKATAYIYDFFSENNTSYIAMEYLVGMTLLEYLCTQPEKKLSLEATKKIIAPLLKAMHKIHAFGIIHRDIAPDNIFLTKDKKIKLIDFGAARYSMGKESKTLSVILKQGYAPPEQYATKSKQGAFTDIYALAATMFRMLSGYPPIEATERQIDDREFAVSIKTLPLSIQMPIKKAMELQPDKRIQNAREFQKILYPEDNNISVDTTVTADNKITIKKNNPYTPRTKRLGINKKTLTAIILSAVLIGLVFVSSNFFRTSKAENESSQNKNINLSLQTDFTEEINTETPSAAPETTPSPTPEASDTPSPVPTEEPTAALTPAIEPAETDTSYANIMDLVKKAMGKDPDYILTKEDLDSVYKIQIWANQIVYLNDDCPSDTSFIISKTHKAVVSEGPDEGVYENADGLDMRDIIYFRNLHTLSLSNYNSLDTTPLKDCAMLENLAFECISDPNLLSVYEIDTLVNLYIKNINFINLDGIENLTALKSLNLQSNRISDVSQLKYLGSLEILNLSDNSISDLTPIGELTNLKTLNLSKNTLYDIYPLLNCTKLEELNLADCIYLERIIPVDDLTELHYLNITGCTYIKDFENLSANTDLIIER